MITKEDMEALSKLRWWADKEAQESWEERECPDHMKR